MNKSTYKFTCTIFFALILSMVNAQNIGDVTTEVGSANVQVTQATLIGSVGPLSDMARREPLNASKKARLKALNKKPNNFVGRGNKVTKPKLEHQGEDPIWQKTFSSNSPDLTLLVNKDGLSTGVSPNDPSGDIGQDHYLQAINVTYLGIYDKDGTLLDSFTANTLWEPLGYLSAGDPIILYDQQVNRWLITEFPDPNQLLIAVSRTEDPLGIYDVYNFGTPSFPDYPKYGIWNNAYTVTTNEDAGALASYLIDRDALLDGEPTIDIQRIELPGNLATEAGFYVATPVDWSGKAEPDSDPCFIVIDDSSWGNAREDQINIYSVDVDFENPSNTTIETTSIVTTPFDSYPCSEEPDLGFECVPQRTGHGLDAVPEIIMNQAHYRNFGSHESMVFNFITDVTNGGNTSGIRWVELRKTTDNWELYQEGTFGPNDGKDRYMGSICMDGSGNIALVYNVSSDVDYAGIRMTGRLADDPLGEMTLTETTLVDGSVEIRSDGRFGDYAHMSIDPSNDRTFWYTGEYAASFGRRGDTRTRIAAFNLQKDSLDLAITQLVAPQSAANLTNAESVTVEVANVGILAMDNFDISYRLNNGTEVLENVNQSLAAGDTYIHTFSKQEDLEAVSEYEFVLGVSATADENILNDSLVKTVLKLPTRDVEIITIKGADQLSCTSTRNVVVEILNLGTETINNVDIEVLLNDDILPNLSWSGQINYGGRAFIPYTIQKSKEGINVLEMNVLTVDNQLDEDVKNNSSTVHFETLKYGSRITLEINFDEYPEENSWSIENAAGVTILSSSLYTTDQALQTMEVELCLHPDSCYSFTMYDVYGDGMCCDGGRGSYRILDEDGSVLVNSNGRFDFSETNTFCTQSKCLMASNYALTQISQSGANDGAILLEPLNASDPIQYSIDNGINFQSTPLFENLSAGSYTCVVIDALDCTDTIVVELQACMIDFDIKLSPEKSGEMDGSITIEVNSGRGPYRFSIDGGINFQSSNTFDGLSTGTYNVVVRDLIGCVYEREVMVDLSTNTILFDNEPIVKISPNPTHDIIRMTISGLDHPSSKLELKIFDSNGRSLRRTSIFRYDDTYDGQVSFAPYPAGVYYIQMQTDDPQRQKLVRIIKR